MNVISEYQENKIFNDDQDFLIYRNLCEQKEFSQKVYERQNFVRERIRNPNLNRLITFLCITIEADKFVDAITMNNIINYENCTLTDFHNIYNNISYKYILSYLKHGCYHDGVRIPADIIIENVVVEVEIPVEDSRNYPEYFTKILACSCGSYTHDIKYYPITSTIEPYYGNQISHSTFGRECIENVMQE